MRDFSSINHRGNDELSGLLSNKPKRANDSATLTFKLVMIIFFAAQLYILLITFSTYTSSPYTMGVFLGVAKSSAELVKFNFMVILLPICKRFLSVTRSRYTHIMYNSSVIIHKTLGIIIVIFSIIHTIAHVFNYLNSKLFILNTPGWTGLMLCILFGILATSSLPSVVKHHYRIFYYCHMVIWLIIPVLVVHGSSCLISTMHETACKNNYHLFLWIGMFFYFVELILSRIWSKKVHCYMQDIGIAVELRFKIPFRHSPGQYVMIKMPSVSHISHPFTILSHSKELTAAVTILKRGRWTRRVVDNLVEIDGPFDTPAMSIFYEQKVTIICSGIGITPFLSIISELTQRGDGSISIHLLWIIWDLEILKIFKLNEQNWLKIDYFYREDPDFDKLSKNPIYVCANLRIIDKLKKIKQKKIFL
eukprot:NODE_659_length_5444_cov_0.092423.p1 type:complete len:420 gc:universal NODE_659_length_5444_cov_0.092423:1078-2337(+)